MYITIIAIIAMIIAILYNYSSGTLFGVQDFQSFVQAIYLIVMIVLICIRLYQVHLLPGI